MSRPRHRAEPSAAPETEPFTSSTDTTRQPAAGGEPATPMLGQQARPVLPVLRALTPRALVVGLVLVALVAAVTPYNDYVLENSPFIGNHFPIGIVTLMALLALLVNPAVKLVRLRPLGQGELVVIMSLLLVGAAAPSSGLMRYFESLLVAPFSLAKDSPWLKPIAALIPSWLVPTTDGNSSIARGFMIGMDFLRGEHIPVLPFLLPALLWSVFIGATLGASMYLAAIFRKQWVNHERLSYPLATIPLELLAAPSEGQYYNKLWRNGVMWAGALIPILIGVLNGLHSRWPAVPEIKLTFDFTDSFRDFPWNNMPGYLSRSTLYMSVVGICFFVPSEIALSLWLFLVVNGVLRVFFAGNAGLEQMEPVRGMGIYFAYFAGIVWLARRHLRRVLFGALRNLPQEEGEFGTHRSMVKGYLICSAVAWLWLMAVGVQWWVALLLMAVGTVMVTLMARIVAETGLFFVSPSWWGSSFFASLLAPKFITTQSFYWTQIVSRLFYADLRETLMPYATNVMRMAGRESDVHNVERPKLFKWLFVAIFVSALVSGVTHHAINYSRGRNNMPADSWASQVVPYGAMSETYTYSTTQSPVPVGKGWAHFGLGAAMVTALMFGRVMFVSWPFHPIGLLLMNAGPMQAFWFSIFMGWGIKQLLMRYGGAGVFRRARPFFIGLIVGEMLIAGVWMFIGLATNGEFGFSLLPR